jgi:manganese transport protein
MFGLNDLSTRRAAAEVLSSENQKRRPLRILPFLGPAVIASVAYIDPGNFATNIQGGAQFGYTLLWVIIASNLIAMLVQTLSAKLGIATNQNLAELCRSTFSHRVVITMWLLMEAVAMATDLAEFVGAAIGFNLLLGVSPLAGGLLTAIVTFVLLALERYGFRPLEAAISALVGVIGVSYLIETLLEKLDWKQVMRDAVVPQFTGRESVLLAVGILGATVMPHVIFLHSALTEERIKTRDPVQLRRLFHFELLDVVLAMGVAGLINCAMLLMAASTFHDRGMLNVGTIEQAYVTLQPALGRAAGWFFAAALLASGLSSSAVGTMSGQVVMEGFLRRHIPVWIRRLVTMVPSLAVLAIGIDPTRTLVISQVVLSFGLPLAVIPLIFFTMRRNIMGVLTNRWYTNVLSVAAAAVIVLLNLFLLYQLSFGG